METTSLRTGEYASSSNIYKSAFWHQRISWGAVIAGLIIAVFIQLTLSILGLAIGLGTLDVANNGNTGQGLAIGTGIWYIASLLIALFAGGWVAGRLAKDKHTSESVIHGLLVCALMFVLTFYFLTSAIGSVIGGVGSLVGKTISTATSMAPTLQQAAQNRYDGGKQVAKDSASIVNAITPNNPDQALAETKRIADQAASATSTASWYVFFGIILSMLTSAFAAKFGRDSKEAADYHGRPVETA
ncbi:MAG: hypothetical protein EOP42_21270 [Sphingobacteriaceae bacterium]|nr:MAG: hypothetical protein EOP42_21270 [Sphingobacteriaceae bacterium]